MTKHHLRAILVAAAFGLTPTAFAQPASAPATTASGPAAPAEGMAAVVEQVSGNVRVKIKPDGQWEPATPGLQLPEGAIIRTGLRSAIRCVIPPDQTFTLDRLGEIEVTQAVKQGNLVKTDLTMKYGRAQYRIEKAGLDHDATISSPGSTLAVRGTTVELEDTPPFKPRAVSYTGRASFRSERRTSIVGEAGGKTARVEAGFPSAANAALVASIVDPQYVGSRTQSDRRLIAQQVSLGAVAGFDDAANIRTLRGGSGPFQTESQLVSALPGRLDFVARWTGNADINLLMYVSYGDPATNVLAGQAFKASEFIYPGYGLNVSPSGGRTDFDHKGGPNGGQEIVYWKNTFPAATFAFDVVHVSGAPTDVTVNAFLDGKKLAMFEFGALVPVIPADASKSTTYTYTMKPGDFAVPLVFIPLTDDNPIAQIPDGNNGQPADLGTTLPGGGGDTGGQDELKAARKRDRQQQRAEKVNQATQARTRDKIPQTPALSRNQRKNG